MSQSEAPDRTGRLSATWRSVVGNPVRLNALYEDRSFETSLAPRRGFEPQTLLTGVAASRASTAILDITGHDRRLSASLIQLVVVSVSITSFDHMCGSILRVRRLQYHQNLRPWNLRRTRACDRAANRRGRAHRDSDGRGPGAGNRRHSGERGYLAGGQARRPVR
jgi:hypothetical protein